MQGIDSNVGAIALDKKDTIYFDLGWHSNDLKEREPYIIVDGKVYLMNIHNSLIMILISIILEKRIL